MKTADFFSRTHGMAAVVGLSLLLSANACKSIQKDNCLEVYYNGNIHTMDKSLPQATAIAVQNGKILDIGTDSDMQEYRDRDVRWIDLKEQTVLPGLIETHIHPAFAVSFSAADALYLDENWNKDEIIACLQDYYREKPDIQYIVALGFIKENVLDAESGLPTKYDLDAVSTEIPVFLYDEGLHSSWCNSKALEIAGVDADSPDPGGESYFIRMDGSNEPSGYNIENASMYIYLRLPFQSVDNLYDYALELFADLNSFGFTGVFDAGEDIWDGFYELVTRLSQDGGLNLYYQKGIKMAGHLSVAENIGTIKRIDREYSSEHLAFNVGKIWLDGTLEVNTAALFEPVLGDVNTTEPFYSQEALTANIRELLSNGYNVHIHVIGDKAQDFALNAFLATDGINPHLTRTLAHNEVFSTAACEKIAALKSNFFITSTPSWTIDEELEYSTDLLGAERVSRMYLWRSAMEAGAKVCFGSDFPASGYEDINPFYQIYCAEKRLDPANGFLPPSREGLTREEGLMAYTVNAAQQLGISDRTGSLSVGKNADFIVISKDILSCDLEDIPDIEVEQVIFNGKSLQGLRK